MILNDTTQILDIFNNLSAHKIFSQKCYDISNINKDNTKDEYFIAQFKEKSTILLNNK